MYFNTTCCSLRPSCGQTHKLHPQLKEQLTQTSNRYFWRNFTKKQPLSFTMNGLNYNIGININAPYGSSDINLTCILQHGGDCIMTEFSCLDCSQWCCVHPRVKKVPYLWTSIVSSRRKDTQAHRKKTWLQKIKIPMKKPAPRMIVSAGWAYSACMPNGAWKTEEKLWRHAACVRDSGGALYIYIWTEAWLMHNTPIKR